MILKAVPAARKQLGQIFPLVPSFNNSRMTLSIYTLLSQMIAIAKTIVNKQRAKLHTSHTKFCNVLFVHSIHRLIGLWNNQIVLLHLKI